MSDKPLPAWPVRDDYVPAACETDVRYLYNYERARADKWEQVARLAVEALEHIAAKYDWNPAREALAKIGPLPELPE